MQQLDHWRQTIARFKLSKKNRQYILAFLLTIFAVFIIVWVFLSRRAFSTDDFLNIGLYILLCTTSIFCGLGILSLLKIKFKSNKALFIAPVISMSLLILLLFFTVMAKVPIHSSYLFIWSIFLVLAVFGFIKNKKYLAGRNKWLLAGCAILPLLVMAVPYWYGSATKFGDILPDGWLYITVGQYLWKFPFGTEGGLSPLYQSAYGLSTFRISSSAFLALLAPFYPYQDTAAGSGVYLAWIIFAFTSSCGFFITDKIFSRMKKTIYIILVIFSGWTWDILWAANYDNLLALVFIPILIEIITNQKYFAIGEAILTGVIFAAFTFAYPEYSIIMFFLLLIILVVRLIRCNQADRKQLLYFVLLAGSICLVLLLPLFNRLFLYFQTQIIYLTGNKGNLGRPGPGMFEGLINSKCMPSAFWGMGCELTTINFPWLYVGEPFTTDSLLPVKNIIAWVLTFLVILGIADLIQKRRWGDLVPLLLVIPISYMILHESYSYGAYKFIILLWWLIPYFLIAGIDLLQNRFRADSGLVFVLAFFTILLFLGNTIFRVSYVALTKPAIWQSDYAQIREVPIVKQNTPILINVNDWLSSEWANYYLRDQDFFLLERRRYMALYPEVMDRAKKIAPSEIHYILSDDVPAGIPVINKVWTGKPYSIWKLSDNWNSYIDINTFNQTSSKQ